MKASLYLSAIVPLFAFQKDCSAKLKFISPTHANFLATNNSAGEVCSRYFLSEP